MKNTILTILQCCDNIRELTEEFNKPFGWLKFKEKKEYKELKNKLMEMIDSLKDDKWDIEYIKNMENTFLYYWDKLEKYSEDISITKDNNIITNKFIPIYFYDIENNKMYILNIKGNSNIIFTIIHTKTGRYLEIIGGESTNSSQAKVEMQCKEKIIDILKNYLNDITINKNSGKQKMIKNIEQDIQI